MGVVFHVKQISYENSAPQDAKPQVEGYLQRCLFDDTINLEGMRANPMTGPHLETCLQNGQWRFQQHVMLIFLKS
jgi:hypothetical protein